MSALLPARDLSPDDRYYLETSPTECHEEVTRKRQGEAWTEPCEKLAVAARYDPESGGAYPVCGRHARGELVALADLLDVGGLWARESA